MLHVSVRVKDRQRELGGELRKVSWGNEMSLKWLSKMNRIYVFVYILTVLYTVKMLK